MLGPNATMSGHSEVGACSLVGVGASLLPWRKIGDNSVVGGGTVVNRDVPCDCKVVGNPARVLGSIGRDDTKTHSDWTINRIW